MLPEKAPLFRVRKILYTTREAVLNPSFEIKTETSIMLVLGCDKRSQVLARQLQALAGRGWLTCCAASFLRPAKSRSIT